MIACTDIWVLARPDCVAMKVIQDVEFSIKKSLHYYFLTVVPRSHVDSLESHVVHMKMDTQAVLNYVQINS